MNWRFWKKKAEIAPVVAPKPVPINPAETADIVALQQAIRILKRAKDEYTGLSLHKVGDPVWKMIWHAEYMLTKQFEEALHGGKR